MSACAKCGKVGHGKKTCGKSAEVVQRLMEERAEKRAEKRAREVAQNEIIFIISGFRIPLKSKLKKQARRDARDMELLQAAMAAGSVLPPRKSAAAKALLERYRASQAANLPAATAGCVCAFACARARFAPGQRLAPPRPPAAQLTRPCVAPCSLAATE
jgi:hypothetical protein